MRECPKCHTEMKEDCYLKDDAQALSDFVIIEKNDDYKKTAYPLKIALCKKCGHVEFYIDIK